ncbi:MAG: AraC family transcriptional regulator [Erysipelotrichaceae bacterium]
MSDIEQAVVRMQEYIDGHLDEPITLIQLARAAGYSPYHAAHLFSASLGISPLKYIRRLRLSAAAAKLRDENEAILQIAFDFQFDSHEGFTKAFSKQFGMSPREYRRNSPAIPLFRPFRYLTQKNEVQTMETQTVFVQLIQRPLRKAIILRGKQADEYFTYCEEVGCDVWGTLCSIKEALNEPMGMWLPAKLIKPDTSRYVQGVEVPDDYAKPLPAGFEYIELEPCTYMVFQGEPYDDEQFENVIISIQSVIDRYHPETVGYRFDETAAPLYQLEPRGERGYIEARPVVKI